MAVALFAAVVALTLVIAGCGSDAKIGDGAEVAAAQGQVRPAGAGSVTGADATPQPDALTPTPTSTPASAPGLTPDNVSEPLAADATASQALRWRSTSRLGRVA
jgi:hypothetical protein